MSAHLTPRSSLARSPVKIAVKKNDRHRPSAASMTALISSGAAMSTPTLSLPF
jgi:hypothetical protein